MVYGMDFSSLAMTSNNILFNEHFRISFNQIFPGYALQSIAD